MRVAWVMKLKPGNEAAYKARHDSIWPEMKTNPDFSPVTEPVEEMFHVD